MLSSTSTGYIPVQYRYKYSYSIQYMVIVRPYLFVFYRKLYRELYCTQYRVNVCRPSSRLPVWYRTVLHLRGLAICSGSGSSSSSAGIAALHQRHHKITKDSFLKFCECRKRKRKTVSCIVPYTLIIRLGVLLWQIAYLFSPRQYGFRNEIINEEAAGNQQRVGQWHVTRKK